MPPPVLLTRSRADNARLARRLRVRGVPVIAWPTMRMQVVSPLSRADLATRVAAGDVVVFTSRRGVLALRALLGRGVAKQLAPPRRVAVVGAATAALTRRLGVEPAWIGSGGGADLARILARELPPGCRIVLPRAAGADAEPIRIMGAAGLPVDDLPVYRQAPPERPASEPVPLGAVVCASPSAAQRVLAWHPWVRSSPFVAIGETTAEALRRLGVADIRIAAGTSPDLLCAAVLDTLSARDAR